MLCYTVGPQVLRLLDLHNSASLEDTVDTRALLQSIPGENLANNEYKFRPIHYSDDIVSCLYIPRKTEGPSRLIVVDTRQKKVLTHHRLDSCQKLFVRNNRDYLYYGTHSMRGNDGFKRWVLNRFDIKEEQWNPGQLNLQDLVGSDIGSTVCFEIIDGYFYALSSLTSFELYETEWTSYYYGFRFPLGSSRPSDMELMSEKSMWRRQNGEGPIDDRWSTLALGKDPATGKLVAVECRREWLVDDCWSTRTSYRTEVRFSDEDDKGPGVDDMNEFQNDDRNHVEVRNDVEVIDSPTSGSECSTAEHHLPKNGRDPKRVHKGDSGSTTPTITLTHCYIRSYNLSCETFIDLVNDPAASESMAHRPQLRSISRCSPAESRRMSATGPAVGSRQHDEANNISWWLPEAEANNYKTSLHALDNILNPRGKSFHGSISGVMDDRSMVYAVGQRDSNVKRPLVFISFDPAIRLSGLDHWPGGPQKQPDPADSSGIVSYPTPESMPVSASASRNASFCNGRIPVPPEASTNPEPSIGKSEALVWGRETAMYLNSSRSISTPIGFNFAYCGDHRGPFCCRS